MSYRGWSGEAGCPVSSSQDWVCRCILTGAEPLERLGGFLVVRPLSVKFGGSCAFGFTGLFGTDISLWGVRLETYTDRDDFCLGDRQLSTLSSGSRQ